MIKCSNFFTRWKYHQIFQHEEIHLQKYWFICKLLFINQEDVKIWSCIWTSVKSKYKEIFSMGSWLDCKRSTGTQWSCQFHSSVTKKLAVPACFYEWAGLNRGNKFVLPVLNSVFWQRTSRPRRGTKLLNCEFQNSSETWIRKSTLELNECSFGNLLARCNNTANCSE